MSLLSAQFGVAPFDDEQIAIAFDAFKRYGKAIPHS
jgi:hypothetical protein